MLNLEFFLLFFIATTDHRMAAIMISHSSNNRRHRPINISKITMHSQRQRIRTMAMHSRAIHSRLLATHNPLNTIKLSMQPIISELKCQLIDEPWQSIDQSMKYFIHIHTFSFVPLVLLRISNHKIRDMPATHNPITVRNNTARLPIIMHQQQIIHRQHNTIADRMDMVSNNFYHFHE